MPMEPLPKSTLLLLFMFLVMWLPFFPHHVRILGKSKLARRLDYCGLKLSYIFHNLSAVAR